MRKPDQGCKAQLWALTLQRNFCMHLTGSWETSVSISASSQKGLTRQVVFRWSTFADVPLVQKCASTLLQTQVLGIL